MPIPPTPSARRTESTDSGADCRRGGHLHNGRKMTWRTNIHMLHFRFVGNGFQLALCSVGWPATRESVVLVPDPTVSASWSVLLDRGEPCGSCQDTSDDAATDRRLEVVCSATHWGSGLLLSSWCCVPSFVPCPTTSPLAGRPWR